MCYTYNCLILLVECSLRERKIRVKLLKYKDIIIFHILYNKYVSVKLSCKRSSIIPDMSVRARIITPIFIFFQSRALFLLFHCIGLQRYTCKLGLYSDHFILSQWSMKNSKYVLLMSEVWLKKSA